MALLGGVALVLAVHLLSWPLTGSRLGDSSVGLGVVFTAAALLAVAAVAVLLRREREW